MAFDGAKLAIISGDCVLTLLRDDKPDIPFPNMWDFPGGGREGDESPEQCVLRETREEFGLDLSPDILSYRVCSDGWRQGQIHIWFFGVVVNDLDLGRIRFRNEGQRWEMMPIDMFLAHPKAIAHLRERLCNFMEYIGKN